MMQFSRIVLLLSFRSVLLMESGPAVMEHQACYGRYSARDCSQHRLQCQEGSIFLTQAVRGFKPLNISDSDCPYDRRDCQNIDSCCRYVDGEDCLEFYTQKTFSALAEQCWNKQACYYTVPPIESETCARRLYRYGSRYSKVHYLCVPDSAVLHFNDTRRTTASSFALRYASSSQARYHTCLVEANDCTSLPMEVALVETNTVSSAGLCIFSPVGKGNQIFCSSNSARNVTFQSTTPFYVQLLLSEYSDAAQAWLLIYSNTSSTVRVMCKPWEDRSPFPECSATTTSSPSSETMPPTESQTAASSARPDTTSDTDLQSLSTPTPADGTDPDVTAENMPQSANNSSSTAGIVGAVLGVVVLLLVVALVMTVVFFRRRSPQDKEASNGVAWSKGGNSSNGNPPAAGSPDSGRAKLRMTPAQPTSLPAYENSAVANTDEAGVRVDPDSDYNHLGQKPTSSASRDVTYGHVADSDVTDYDYDHVAKGKPAVRSGDVINNVYNTAGPATGGSSDEDFYNTTAKNRPDVINNVYNAPSASTEAGCDADYYNVTGTPHTTHDAANHDYSTPKPGRDVGSPYELARNMK